MEKNMNLREVRRSLGLTQAEFGKVLFVSRSTYIKIENGEKAMPDCVKMALDRYLDDNEIRLKGVNELGLCGKELIEALVQAEQAQSNLSRMVELLRARV